MLQQIDKLHTIANANQRLIVGLMSGTSLDGLDIALCRITGSGGASTLDCLAFTTVDYTDEFKAQVLAVFAKQQVSLDALCLLNATIGRLHGQLVNEALNRWKIPNDTVDLVASHGQTIYHRPLSLHKTPSEINSTLQLGDGDHIAAITGITTISDFRQKQIAHGGEGAPLAMYGDYLLFASATQDRVLLNIGGIANITYLPANKNFDQVVCSDIGPGNTIMDALASEYSEHRYDKDAAIAKAGTIHKVLLEHLLTHSFMGFPLPKTTGPETFNIDWFKSELATLNLHSLSVADQMATLNIFSAQVIVDSINSLAKSAKVFVSGGGAHNPLLRENIERLLGRSVHLSDELGISTDAKEAVLFAMLANECVCGSSNTFQSTRANQVNISMGKISLP